MRASGAAARSPPRRRGACTASRPTRRARLPLQIAPVGEVGGHQQSQTYQKSNHIPVRFDAKIRRIVKFFAKLLHEINFFQIFAVPKRTQRHQAKVRAGRISSVVEHFTRNEGVPSSSLGFGSGRGGCTDGATSFCVLRGWRRVSKGPGRA